jgi:CRP-like cAMP-binding protein
MDRKEPSPRTNTHSATRVFRADLPELLKRALPSARPKSQQLLTEAARIRNVAPGEVVFTQGEPIPLTLMVEGYGAFRRTTSDGRQLVLDLATRGDFFGLSSISALSSPVDLVAVTSAIVALWPGGVVRPIVTSDPALALEVIDGMARFIVNLAGRLEGFVHQDARRRVVRILDRYSAVFFGETAVLSRAHLPGLVGTSREMTNRVVRQLEQEGMIARVGRGQLRLLSPAALREAAGSAAAERASR